MQANFKIYPGFKSRVASQTGTDQVRGFMMRDIIEDIETVTELAGQWELE